MYRSRRRTIRTTATADPQYPATCRNTRPASPPAVTIPGATASSATGNPPGAAAGNRRYIPAQSVYPAPEATRHRATRHRRQPRQPKPAHPAPPQELFPPQATGNLSCLRIPFPYYRNYPSGGASSPREKGRKPVRNTPTPVSSIVHRKFHPHNPLRDNAINTG